MDKKTLIQQEIKRRKAEIELHKWVKTACIGKTVKEAHEIMTSDKFLEIFVKNTLPVAPAGQDYTDDTLQSLLDLFSFFIFEEVFTSAWAHQNFWNCAHHRMNCDYILSKQDLKPDLPPPNTK